MEERQECHRENGEETTKTQESRHDPCGDQRSEDGFVLQLLHSARRYVGGTKRSSVSMFCSVPEEPEGELDENDDIQSIAADFEIGHMLRDSIVPKAVLYYTGEAGDEEDDEVSDNRTLPSPTLLFLVRRRR